MGNCLRRDKSMIWAGDDWESLAPKNHRHAELYDYEEEEADNIERERLLGGDQECSNSAGTSREIKIKMTKKQLEELVGKSVHDMESGLSSSVLEQVLAHELFMNNIDQQSWRPALQSIPEVN